MDTDGVKLHVLYIVKFPKIGHSVNKTALALLVEIILSSSYKYTDAVR